MTELVALVDAAGTPTGSMSKADVHSSETPLHLAFSCHVVDDAGRLLVSRRALAKKTWPGVWTNSFCGHPAPGEDIVDAVTRRAMFELGLSLRDIVVALPDFQYSATDRSGITENEVCPVFLARADSAVTPNPSETLDMAWTTPGKLGVALETAPWAFSPWLLLHFPLLTNQLADFTTTERTAHA